MWDRGLLIVGDGDGTGTDLRPLALMSDLGRGDFFAVCRESAAAAEWPDEKIDVVMISLGCTNCAPLLKQCLERRIGFVIIGCPRLEREEERRLLREYRAGGGHALGPGSQGFFDWERRLALCWSAAVRMPDSPPQDRHVTLIAQGGTVPVSLYPMAVEAGVRFRRVVSLGNCADSDGELLHCMEEAIGDPMTTLLILSFESLSQGRDFLAMASRAAERRLPVVVLRSGVNEAFRDRLARRHVDAAWTDSIMWESVAGQFGVVLLSDAQQIVDLGKLSSLGLPPQGNRVAVLALSEGLAMMQGDQCREAGLDVVEFSPVLRGKIQALLPRWASAANPADLSEQALNREGALDRILDTLQASEECDMIVVTTGSLTAAQGERLARAVGTAHRRGGKTLACCCLSRWRPLDEMVRRMNMEGVPLFSSPRRVAEALAALWRIGRDVRPMNELCKPARHPFLDRCPLRLSERDAMALVDAYGLKTVTHRLCTSVTEVLETAHSIGFPLVLKVVSPSFASKQQARAVALNLRTEEELRNAYGRILERTSRVHAGAEIQGVVAQKMVTDGIECMIGIKRDPLFGPVVAVALGGAYYGLMKDISLRVAPVSLETAMDMVRSLKGYPLISGEWSGTPMDVEALAQQIVTLSQMGCAEPDIELLDINPIFIRPRGLGAEVADAFAVRRQKTKD